MAIQRTLVVLINDVNFMPDCGYLGFGLRYQYPINSGFYLYKIVTMKAATMLSSVF